MKEETFCIVCKSKTKWKGKTCSRTCADELKKKNNRENRVCKICKKEFEVKKNIKKEMCSDECRKKWNSIPENIKYRTKQTQKTVENKYGVKTVFQLQEVKEKTKTIKKERYGIHHEKIVEKIKNTKKERYNDEGYNNIEKNKQTKKLHHGDENYNNREQSEKTMIKLYGSTHIMKIKKFQEKAIKTNRESYGTDFPMQNKEIREKAEITNIKIYGFKFPSQNEDVKNKIRETYYEKFSIGKIINKLKIANVELQDEYVGIKKNGILNVYNFKCLKCQNILQSTFANNDAPTCRVCYPMYKNNVIQTELSLFLKELNITFFENVRNIISPFELDFYLPEQKIAIEINGNYYHSEFGGEKNKSYHINKSKLCLNKEVFLIHIFEDEWIFKKDIIKNIIKAKLKKIDGKKIFARKCIIKEVETIKKHEFFEENHLQGDSKDNIRIGLFFNEELVSLMSFSKERLSLGKKEKNDKVFELIRFCSKKDKIVIGAFSKILNYFTKKFDVKKIVTFANCRISGLEPERTVYYKNNFKFLKITKPNYWYFKKGNYMKRYHRFTFTKGRLLKQLNEPQLTEWELARSLGMDRIWDCGNMKFELML